MKKTILFVDNARSVRQYCQCELAALGFTVLGAESGEMASKILDSFNVDIVILDQHMPGCSGTQTAEKIKKKRPDLPVILFTTDKRFENYRSRLVEAAVLESADLTSLKAAIEECLVATQFVEAG